MAIVIYDGECGLCITVKRAIEPLDLFRTLKWLPHQDPASAEFGIPRAELRESVWLVSGRRRWSGFAAVKQILLRLPPLYVAAGIAVARRPATGVGIGLFFSPVFKPVGDRLYHWVARHRYSFPIKACNTGGGVNLKS